MHIGYPCINWTIGCKGDRTFRLTSYSEERLKATVSNNLSCLARMLQWNVDHNILFFRITSDLIPFASHPVCKFNWQEYFAGEFSSLGEIIRRRSIRISMHPDQFVVINSVDKKIRRRSIIELLYHSQVLDLLDLDSTAKFQLHVGGVYGNKVKSMERFVENYNRLDESIQHRLVIENDEKLYSVQDCLAINEQVGLPVLLDVFHHKHNNTGETVDQLLELVASTWKSGDGIPMVDYSSQHPAKKAGSHADTIDLQDFNQFLRTTHEYDIDVMLEIKDKENSALQAVALAGSDPRFVKV